MDPRLEHLLQGIAARFRRMRFAWILSIAWLSFAAVIALAVWTNQLPPGDAKSWSRWLPATGLIVVVASWILSRFAYRDRHWLAMRIERRFPNLKQRLLTAIGVEANEPLGYLKKSLLDETIKHSRIHDWQRTVPTLTMLIAWLSQFVSLGLCVAACLWMLSALGEPGQSAADTRLGLRTPSGLLIEPGNVEIERGTNLIVTVRFDKNVPAVVWLDSTSASGKTTRQEMRKNLKDPVFGGFLFEVAEETDYRIDSDNFQSESYRVKVFDYPALVRSDAKIDSPEYSRIEDRVIEDTRRVTVVEGAKLQWQLHVNKPLATAQLVDEQGEITPLTLDTTNPLLYTAEFSLEESRRWKVQLRDAEGRESKIQEELSARVQPNKPPETKLARATDQSVSPIQELELKASASDDFGLQRVGLNYTLGSQDSVDIVLAEGDAVGKKKEVEYLLEFEKLKAEPDQLLNYYFWVEDIDRDGEVRRVDGDMFFAEVRPFEEIFREGESMSAEQMQQMQQQQQSQGAQQAGELAEQQKKIITATWNVLRREKPKKLSEAFEEDLKLLAESQRETLEKAGALREQLQDAQSLQHLERVEESMTAAADKLDEALSNQDLFQVREALKLEQTAYEGLLKLRAREHQIVRSQQQNRNQRGGSGAQQNRQQQLDQLELNEEENRYETERQAETEQDQNERDMRQVMNRLDELARRQNDVNQQLKDLETALQAAKDEKEKEELEEQLKRLRENQEELLRDSDELLERMNQAKDQEAMEQAKQQMEQAREELRKSSEALSQNQTAPALSSGTRAQRQMDETREQLRQQSSNQFEQTMKDMLQEAQELEKKQLELNQQVSPESPANRTGQNTPPTSKTENDPTGKPEEASGNDPSSEEPAGGLRPQGEPEVQQDPAKGWKEQKESLNQLLQDMQETVTEAESSEPLLADKLYDSFRETKQKGIDQRLDQIPLMLDRGLESPAKQAAEEVTQGIQQLRQQIEEAAEGVIGSETEALRRALQELERAKDQLNQEIQRRSEPSQDPSGQPNSQPQQGQPQQGQPQGSESPSESEQREPRNEPSSESNQQQPGQESQNEGQPSEGQANNGEQQNQPGQQARSRQPGSRQNGNPQIGERTGGNNNPADPGGLIDRVADPLNRAAPLTGDEFVAWSDALRDVEEMMRDPDLRAEAARIRETARDMRIDYKRHSKEPQWDLVQKLIAKPLEQLRQKVEQELLRQSAEKNSVVPVDRDPVPTVYQRQLQKYYENLGRGTK